MASEQAVLTAVVDMGLLTEAEVEGARRVAQTTGRTPSEVLAAQGLVAPRTLQAVAKKVSESQVAEVSLGSAVTALPDRLRPDGVPEQLDGFRLEAPLGQGGMGAVFRARQLSMDRPVALKLLAPRLAADAEAKARFLREARAMAALSHPNVITAYEAGEANGHTYLALELVEGGDAQKLLDEAGGGLGEAHALELARDCAQGLAAIHEAGLVHRDIKPANVFLSGDGSAKLGDLGLARTVQGTDRMTQTGVVMGTPAYMAPEQALAEEVDARADIYALGATLFTLLTGRRPFEGGVLEVMQQLLRGPGAPDPGHARPELSPGTRALVMRCMNREPADRPASAEQLAVELGEQLAVVKGGAKSSSGRRQPSSATRAMTLAAVGSSAGDDESAVFGESREPSEWIRSRSWLAYCSACWAAGSIWP